MVALVVDEEVLVNVTADPAQREFDTVYDAVPVQLCDFDRNETSNKPQRIAVLIGVANFHALRGNAPFINLSTFFNYLLIIIAPVPVRYIRTKLKDRSS